MAKSDKKIMRGVRIPARLGGELVQGGGRTYVAGDEDELAELLSAEDAERLVASGALEGTWGGKAKKAESGKAPEAAKK